MKTFNQEITFNSFTKGTYHRSEVLPELLLLQNEISAIAMPNESETEAIKLYDIEKYLEEKNAEQGYKASKELAIFKEGSKSICNHIKALISGQKGESKAFNYLSRLNCKNYILKNVELSSDEAKTELDAVVITEKRIFIIEVKNTNRDIFIDDEGNYYRTGKYLNWDSNILSKMNTKERLLRQSLDNANLEDIKIERIVVFTNNRVRVENNCSSIKTTFLAQLPYIIERTIGCVTYSSKEMDLIKQSIEQAEKHETYEFDFDMEAFKSNFIQLIQKLNGVEVEEHHISLFERFMNHLESIGNKLFSAHPNRLASVSFNE